MAKQYGPWQIMSSSQKYKNQHFKVTEDQVIQPDGDPGIYATVTIKPGIAVLPIGENGEIYLLEQFRYAIGKKSVEVATGAIDEGEEALQAAKRELKEELGIQARDWTQIGSFDLDTAIVNCPVSLFLARSLSFTKKQEDDTEELRGIKMSLSQAVERVMKSEITHSPSCILILKATQAL